MPFDPKPEYKISPRSIPVAEFSHYAEDFVTRPPYQRKNVWSPKKKQDLLDSLFRRYYIPKVVIREIRLGDDRMVNEVVDGQQRIIVMQEFFANKLKLPESLADLRADLPGKHLKDLSAEFRRFVDRLQYDADIITGIDDPHNPRHQELATEIFWRLQQGVALNFMEEEHARLTSRVRNFIVKYADDITFDFEKYKPVDSNPDKLKFFKICGRDNSRMQHLLLLARFLLIEKANESTDLKNLAVIDLIENAKAPDGIGDESYENDPIAQAVISNLKAFYEIFKDDPMIDEGSGLKELSRDYVTISFYMLLRHLRKNYVWNEEIKHNFRDFLINEFYPRWANVDNFTEDDDEVQLFQSSRQMDKNYTETRIIILRQLFFEFAKKQGVDILTKDDKRSFSEAQKIAIYRRDKGLCQQCLKEGKPEDEARVSWSEYEADHVLAHTKGGRTDDETNGQVLCKPHNRKKSGK